MDLPVSISMSVKQTHVRPRKLVPTQSVRTTVLKMRFLGYAIENYDSNFTIFEILIEIFIFKLRFTTQMSGKRYAKKREF